MASALPQSKHYPQERGSKRTTTPKGLPRRLKIAIRITLALFFSSSLLLVTMDKKLSMINCEKGQYLKEYKVLKEKNTLLKREQEELTSPLTVEEIAKSKDMRKATKVYNLSLENL